MTKPYLLFSDMHAHDWSAFATVDAAGLNSRLHIQLNEFHRACAELRDRGGDAAVFAGDMFHVRGSVKPSVFNPVHAAIAQELKNGVRFIAIPGNHDLEGKETTTIGNAFQSLAALDGFRVVTSPESLPDMCLVPWAGSKAKLRELVDELISSISDPADFDLIIHAGIDGMVDGVPASGLTPAECASWGFKRVFAGDYHNHRVAEDGKVISIGATCHQQWGDIGSKAGFLLVYPDRVEYRASNAPFFIELDGSIDEEDYPLIVDGNYVRIRGMKLTDAEIKRFRKELIDMGAIGVTFQVARETVAARAGSSVGKAATLDESVDKFIDTMGVPNVAAVKAISTDVLNTVRSVAA